MYGSIAELIAGNPSFDIPGGRYKGTTPAMPGEDLRQIEEVYRGRPAPSMQDNLRPALPPVRKAANDLLEEAIAQVTPKYLGYGFEADMGGTFGGADSVYIRGTFPEEEEYRRRQYEQMKERMGNPFRGV